MIQVWDGENCKMEPALIPCGEAAATAPCPLHLPNPVTMLEVIPREDLPDAPNQTGTHSGHGLSEVAVGSIVVVVVLFIIFVMLGLWRLERRRYTRQRRVRGPQTFVVALQNISQTSQNATLGDPEQGREDAFDRPGIAASAVSGLTDPPPPYTAHANTSGETLRTARTRDSRLQFVGFGPSDEILQDIHMADGFLDAEARREVRESLRQEEIADLHRSREITGNGFQAQLPPSHPPHLGMDRDDEV